jgi:hypothetical protein
VKLRGKVRAKNLAEKSEVLVVTKEKVMRLLQRAKLMSSPPAPGEKTNSSRAFTAATIASAWMEIVAWRSDRVGSVEEANALAAVSASPTALSFDAAIALLCKLATIRFRSRTFQLPNVSERLNAFLQLCFPLQVLPYTSMASKYYPLQAAMAHANTMTTVGSGANKLDKRSSLTNGQSISVNNPPALPPPPPMAYLGSQSAFEGDENEESLIRRLCDDVLKQNQRWLYYLFTYYAKEKDQGSISSGAEKAGVMEPAMSRENFMEFINESQLLTKKVIYLRTINSIWLAQQQSQAATLAAEAVLNPNAASQQKQSSESLMTYRYFLDTLKVLCVFLVRDPLIPHPVKLDRLVQLFWTSPGFERCRVSMGVSSAVQQGSAANAAAVAQAQAQQAQALQAAKDRLVDAAGASTASNTLSPPASFDPQSPSSPTTTKVSKLRPSASQVATTAAANSPSPSPIPPSENGSSGSDTSSPPLNERTLASPTPSLPGEQQAD